MNTTSLIKRITKHMAGTIAVLLFIIAALSPMTIRTQAYVWPERELELGMTGEDVLSLQTRLAEFGIQVGELDGYFGEVTKDAVMIYQYYAGLVVDGVAGPITLTSLYGPRDDGTGDNTSAPDDRTEENTVSDSTARNLMIGTSGADVSVLQNALEGLGYATGGVDGIFGSKTEAAVIAFQKANGLYVDGIVGPMTAAALSSPAAIRGDQTVSAPSDSEDQKPVSGDTETDSTYELKKGANGDDVMLLQFVLEALGYETGGVDGIFGNYTETAVKAFQTAKGLLVDGIVGPITVAALTSAYLGLPNDTTEPDKTEEPETPVIKEVPPEVDPGFTGFAGNEFGDWYFIDGEVAVNKTCLVKISYKEQSGWWYVKEGKVITFIDTPRLTHISLAKGGIIINWEANEGVRKYLVYRMNSAGEWERLADTSNNYYVDTTVVSGQTYSYTVRAVSPDGNTYLSGYDETGKTLTYFYEYDRYVAEVNTPVTKKLVEDECKKAGLDENEIIAVLAWVEGEAFARINEPYLAYLSACVLINGILDGRYGRGEDVLNYIVRWGTYYTVDKQKARYESVSDAALLATYLALKHPVPGIYGCRGLDYKPTNCYYDGCIVAQGYPVYVW